MHVKSFIPGFVKNVGFWWFAGHAHSCGADCGWVYEQHHIIFFLWSNRVNTSPASLVHTHPYSYISKFTFHPVHTCSSGSAVTCKNNECVSVYVAEIPFEVEIHCFGFSRGTIMTLMSSWQRRGLSVSLKQTKKSFLPWPSPQGRLGIPFNEPIGVDPPQGWWVRIFIKRGGGYHVGRLGIELPDTMYVRWDLGSDEVLL